MDGQTLIDQLGVKLEDAAEGTFTAAIKLDELNNAQVKLAQLLHDNYLTDLQKKIPAVTLTNGQIALTSANLLDANSVGHNVLRGEQGVRKVQVVGGRWCRKIDIDDVKRTQNYYLQGSVQNPLYYVYDGTLFVLPTSISSVDIYIMKTPLPILHKFTITQTTPASTTAFTGDSGQSLSSTNDAYNGAVIYSVTNNSYHVVTDYVGATRAFTVTAEVAGSPNTFDTGDQFYFLTNSFDQLNLSGMTPDLPAEFHKLIIKLAEAECWAINEKTERSNAAMKMAMDEIEILNARFKEAEGIGSKGRKG